MKKEYKNKAIFFDRDGVINKDKGYVYKIEDFNFIDGVFEVIKELKKLDYYVFIITNQSGIGRGYYTKKDFEILNNWMLDKFKKKEASIDKVYYCPHSPESNCNCRKPKPYLILKAIEEYNIDKNKSYVIGDKETDILAGFNAGIKNLILVRSGKKLNVNKTKAQLIIDSVKNLLEINL